MYRKDFLVRDQHFYVDVFMDDAATRKAVYIMTVTVEDQNEKIVKEKTFQFENEKKAKEFIEDLKEEKFDIL